MTRRLALSVAALLAVLLAALLSAPAALGAPQAMSAEAGVAVSAPATATKGRQCLPRPTQQSLVVRGKVTCKQLKRFLSTARELALHTQEQGYDRFTIRGFRCLLKPDYRRFACHDINRTPQRSFVWIDRT